MITKFKNSLNFLNSSKILFSRSLNSSYILSLTTKRLFSDNLQSNNSTNSQQEEEEEEYPIPKFKTNILSDYETARKQVFWRVRNIGQLELEFVMMKWFEKQNLNLEELRAFSEEVLEMENPDMNRYFLKFEEAPEDLVYTRRIQKFLRE